MAGALTISTLNNDTGVLAAQNGMTGIAKAWVNFAGASGTRNSSFNVSSVTRSAQGTYAITFTTAMPDANYTFVGMSIFNAATRLQVVSQDYRTANTGSVLRVVAGYAGSDTNVGFLADATTVCVAVFSS
jgi:hypothetical protein